MKFEDKIKDYTFANVAQFRAIAKSLGYKEEYHSGNFLYSTEREKYKISFNEIMGKCKQSENNKNESLKNLSAHLNKDKINDVKYLNELLSEKKVEIIGFKYNDIKGKEKEGHTIIDHELKCAYNMRDVLNYANKEGYLLDGKGTKLEKGIMSEIMDINGRDAKIRLSENGISIYYKKESLIIPEVILGHKLSHQEQEDLLKGNVVLFGGKRDIYVQVDKELNAVVVRTSKELAIPKVIGQTNDFKGYELTKADKFLLANGQSLDNKLLGSEKGYFIADISLTSDKKGIQFANIQEISKEQALAMIRQQDNFKMFTVEQVPVKDFKNLLGFDTYNLSAKQLNSLLKGETLTLPYKDAKIDLKLVQNEDKTVGIDIRTNRLDIAEELQNKDLDVTVSRNVTFVEPEKQQEKSQEINKNDEKEYEKSPEQVKHAERNLEYEMKEAINKGDYPKLMQLHGEGYTPSAAAIKGIMADKNIPENTKIAVSKIFGLEENKKKNPLADIKIAHSEQPKQAQGQDKVKGVAGVVGKMFQDM